ncbi:Arc family DNA-binding protein [Roseomonas gilardii]|uniref:Arc family DNA-binding protein n=1 Tax=Roseomonas gilardii TaxID=257708 RepID=UPI000952EEB7
MARDDPQTRIRMPSALKEALEAAAFEANRSFNAEVIARLEASLEPQPSAEPLRVMLTEMIHRMDRLEARVKDAGIKLDD